MKKIIFLLSFVVSTIAFATEAVTVAEMAVNNEFKASSECALAGTSDQAQAFCIGIAMPRPYQSCLEQRCEYCAIKTIQSKMTSRTEYKVYAEATVILQGINCKVP